jgi:hypothetical protein
MESSLDLESRFAVFCDELGDFLETLVQRAVDWLEWLFQLDAGGRAFFPFHFLVSPVCWDTRRAWGQGPGRAGLWARVRGGGSRAEKAVQETSHWAGWIGGRGLGHLG